MSVSTFPAAVSLADFIPLIQNKRATRGAQDLDGMPLQYKFIAIPSADPYPLTGTLSNLILCAAGELCILTFTRRVPMFLTSFPAIFQMFVFHSQHLACLLACLSVTNRNDNGGVGCRFSLQIGYIGY